MIPEMRALTLSIAALLVLAACGDDGPAEGRKPAVTKPFADGRPLVEGTVTAPGDEPLSGVSVFLRLPWGAGVAGQKGLTTETDEDGYFAFDLEGTLDPQTDGPVELTFRKEGSVTFQHRFDTWKPGRGISVNLILLPAGKLRGVVRDKAGGPVAGAIVYGIRADVPGVRRLVEVIHTTSAPDGTFLLEGMPVGRIDIGVKAAGFLTSVATDVTVTVHRVTPVREVILVPGKTIAGRVILSDGKGPVTRALVRVYQNRDLADFAYFGRAGAGKGGGSARVDGEGRFRITGLPDGEWDVEALTLGLAPVRPGAANVAAGTEDLELEFVRATAVKLRVIDGETGKALPRFQVVIQSLTGPKASDGRPVVTEEIDVRSPVGEYSFPAREDEKYSVETTVQGYENDQRTVGPLKGGPAKLVRIFLKRRE